MNLLNTYTFTTNHGDEIDIKAYFEEEAIKIFQKKYQRIGPKYYHPTVFTKIEKANKTIIKPIRFKRAYR